ncbi:hypothetical protein [Synoicihabitans lomoniglobus]|uniref:Uncharacterized protein n=1 Tax=Synoicihabitans lomoniglobus TaxID=2909285 RepID=A0AAE9ZV88_9BACT|nr:hypothetical protein [Opitutaceae bacterium LMO-M01]WED65685.1 hypothetical protein PXH66_02345 [Opitutaceae bacterium LMO-M01]
MSALPIRIPVFKTRPRYVVMLPDHRFFVRSVPLATGEGAGSVREQIELALETVAPFPLSQLYWGYWSRKGGDRALVFAAYQKRFAAAEIEDWGEAEWVVPQFGAVLAGKPPEPATTVILRSAEGLTALHFGDASGVPTVVKSIEVAEESSDREWDAARETLIRECGGSRTILDVSRAEVDPGKPGDDEITVRRDGERVSFDLDEAQMLDVRDPTELAGRRRARLRDTWLWRGLVAAAIIILISALGEGGLYGLEKWQQGRRAKIAAQVPLVSEIETADRLANRIDELKNKRLRPFEMIGIVDQPRPEEILFLSTAATGLYSMEIEAVTESPTAVNTYISALSALPGTETVEALSLDSRGSRTTVRLLVRFNADAFQTAIQPAAGEVSS